ncbi:hypothetical protein OG203_35145 [Nocardia sp. NBC_01499]|uniref:hypothetical protein n=1 Tax=Nocardia sp. NBC_01499 TaxID=2903597 RepID=UPI003864F837
MSEFDFWRDVIGDDLVVDGVVYSATEWESDSEGGVQRIADRVRRDLDERFDPEMRAHANLWDVLDSPFSVTFVASAPDAENRIIQITSHHGWTALELETQAGRRPEIDSTGISPHEPTDLRVVGEYRIQSESLARLLEYLAAEPVLHDDSSLTDRTTGRPPVLVPEKERTILQQHQSRINTVRDAVRIARSPAALAAVREQVAAELQRHEASAPDLHGGASDSDIALYDITRDGYRTLMASLDERMHRRSDAQVLPTTHKARTAAVSEQNRVLVTHEMEMAHQECEAADVLGEGHETAKRRLDRAALAVTALERGGGDADVTAGQRILWLNAFAADGGDEPIGILPGRILGEAELQDRSSGPTDRRYTALVEGPLGEAKLELHEFDIIVLPDDLAYTTNLDQPSGAVPELAPEPQQPDATHGAHRERLRERFDPQHQAYVELEKLRDRGVNVMFAAATETQPYRVVQITFTELHDFAARELAADPEWLPALSAPAPMYLDGVPLRPIGNYRLDDTEHLAAVIGQLKRGPTLNGKAPTRREPVLVPAVHEATLLEFLTDLDNHLGRVQEKGTLDALLAAHQAVSSEMGVMRLGDTHPEIYWECEMLQAELDGRIGRVLNGLEPLDEKATGYVDPDPWSHYLDSPSTGLVDFADTRLAQIADQIETAVRQRFDPAYPQWKALHDAETRGVYVEFAAPADGNPGRRVSIRYNSDAGQWQAREYRHEHHEDHDLTAYVGDYLVDSGVHPWLGEFLDGLESRPVLIHAQTGEAIPRPAVHPPDTARAQLWTYVTDVAELAAGLDIARETAGYRAAHQELAGAINEAGHSTEWTHAAQQLLDEFGGRTATSDAVRESSARATESISDWLRPPNPTDHGVRALDGSSDRARGGDHAQDSSAQRAEAKNPDSTTSWAQRIRSGLSKPPAAHPRRRI